MNATDIIKKVKNENTPITVWYGTRTNWDETARDTSSNPNYTERITDFYEDREEAWEAIEASEKNAEFGKYDIYDLWEAKVSPDDLDGIDWEEIEEWDNFDEEKFYELIHEENCTEWDAIVNEVSYEYPSVEGALLVEWNWERYIGYARNINCIRLGMYSETEEICCKEDMVFRPQVDVLCTAEELDGLSPEQERDLVEERLQEDYRDWRWTRQAESYIRHYLHDNYEQEEDNDEE